ncbi:MAG: hypothetical protein OXG55_13320 [bacterium]|nr:hypothetical protein [bacterium]
MASTVRLGAKPLLRGLLTSPDTSGELPAQDTSRMLRFGVLAATTITLNARSSSVPSVKVVNSHEKQEPAPWSLFALNDREVNISDRRADHAMIPWPIQRHRFAWRIVFGVS